MKRKRCTQFFVLLVICFLSWDFIALAQLNLSFASRFEYDLTFDYDGIEDTTCANVWGWTSPSGNEYALVGAKHGTGIVDFTNPYVPIQVQFVSSAPVYNLWKEIKTYQHYMYVVSEGSGHGLKITDLSTLPGPVTTVTISFSTNNRAHALYIDEEQGYLYMFGTSGFAGGGCVIWDLNADPMNPTIVGMYSSNYIHDGYVRDNILYAGAIYLGQIQMINVATKSSPFLIGSATTPTAFTHNTWLNDAGNVCFTTDENAGSYLGAFDITDPSAITEIDRVRDHTAGNAIVHNVHVKDDYAVCSYYTSGVVVFDVHVPDIMVEIANYDCNPTFSGNAYEEIWGVYPYFPSGTVIATDIQQGLFVLIPNYVRASYLRGVVRDACGNPIYGATVQVSAPTENKSINSVINGKYKLGFNDEGLATVTVNQPSYQLYTTTINLVRGVVDTLDIILQLPSCTVSNSGNDTICSGNTVVLNASTLSGSYTYQWLNNDIPIGGATSSSYTATATGLYTVKATYTGSPSCYSVSDSIRLTVLPQPIPMIDGIATDICAGNTYTYSINDIPGYDETIWWDVSGGEILSGQGTHTVIIRWDIPGAGTLNVSQSIP